MANSQDQNSSQCVDEDRVSMNQLRNDGFLADFSIVANDGSRFFAHKFLLAASSDFFFAFFSSGNNNTNNNNLRADEIKLPSVSPNALAKCLEVVYAGTTLIASQAELDDFLRAASFLQMKRAIRICEDFLTQQISSRNLDGIYTLADRYTLRQTLTAVGGYLERRLAKLAKKDSTLGRIAYRQIVEVLKSDRLAIRETDLLSIATRWLEVTNQSSNRHVVRSLLHEIRLMLVDHDVLVSLLPIVHDLSIPGEVDATSFKLVFQALDYLSKPHLQPTILNGQNKIRARRKVNLRIAGKSLLPNGEEVLSSEVLQIDSQDLNDVEILEMLPANAVSHHQVVVLNGFVFVIGGARTICQRGLTATSTVFRLDTRSNRWWQAASMKECRAYFAAGVIGDAIYVAGGEYRFVATRTCEVYRPLTNTWSYVAPMPDEFSGNAGCAGDDGRFYSFGGWKGDDARGDICADAYRYDPAGDAWQQLPDMCYDRAFHCCIAVDRRIYVFGGVDHRKRPIAFGEFFDIDRNQWLETSPMPSMHNEGACFPIVEKGGEKIVGICVCGGYDASNKPQTMMAMYDFERDSWASWRVNNVNQYCRFAGSAFVNVEVPDYGEDQPSGVIRPILTTERIGTLRNGANQQSSDHSSSGDERGAASERRARGSRRPAGVGNGQIAADGDDLYVDQDYSF